MTCLHEVRRTIIFFSRSNCKLDCEANEANQADANLYYAKVHVKNEEEMSRKIGVNSLFSEVRHHRREEKQAKPD